MPLNGIDFLAWVLVGLSAAGCAYLGLSVLAVRRLVAAAPRTAAVPVGVSVLKPLYGVDAELAANLRSFCRQDHPAYQVIFGVRDADDPAIAVVRQVMAEFPDRDLALVVDGGCLGGNLKVANLRNMLPSARYPVIVLSDSDMRVDPNYLTVVSAPLADRAADLVTCL